MRCCNESHIVLAIDPYARHDVTAYGYSCVTAATFSNGNRLLNQAEISSIILFFTRAPKLPHQATVVS